MENVYEILNILKIDYKEIEHKAVFTIEEALNENIQEKIDGYECKNLFLKGKNNYYLVLIDALKKTNINELSKMVNEKKLRFSTIEELNEILKLSIGSVSPLGIINDINNKTTLLIDKTLINKKILMHPNINTKTISITYEDLIKIIEHTNHKYILF